MKRYDVIIVGAGPAGLFAALELVKSGKRIALIDKGREITSRLCPLVEGKASQCLHCTPCNAVCGWGGAGSFSDGKLTLTPEFGGNLERYCGRETLLKLIDEVDRLFVAHGAPDDVFTPDPVFAEKIREKARKANLEIIPATIRHMGTDRSKAILQSFYSDLENRCEILLGKEVQSVLVGPHGKVEGVALSNGEVLHADFVLLAPGREGAAWMEKTIHSLGLSIDSLPVDIGVRVEIPAVWAKEITDQFYEIKALLNTPTFDDRVRTFCMCPNGEVSMEYQSLYNIVTVNGHSNRDPQKKTENTNFAILVSTEFTKPFHDPNGYGSHVARLANMLGGTVLVQRLGDLRKGRRSTASRIERGLVKPTLSIAEPGDLSFALPYRHLTGILEMLEALDGIIPGVNGPQTLLYGVEVKFYSLKVGLDTSLKTSIEGLYAAGDGAGVTRGVVQASASGIWAARSILKAMEGPSRPEATEVFNS